MSNIARFNPFAGYRTSYLLKHPGKLAKNIKHIFVSAFERASRGYAEEDWWNFDSYIAKIIASNARRFANSDIAHGYHEELGEQGTFDMYNCMADGFERYSDFMSDEDTVAYEEALLLFVKYHARMWD